MSRRTSTLIGEGKTAVMNCLTWMSTRSNGRFDSNRRG